MNSINVLIEMTFSGQLFGRSWTFLWHFPFMDSINVPGQIDFSCKLATTFWTHVCLNSIINNRIVFFSFKSLLEPKTLSHLKQLCRLFSSWTVVKWCFKSFFWQNLFHKLNIHISSSLHGRNYKVKPKNNCVYVP